MPDRGLPWLLLLAFQVAGSSPSTPTLAALSFLVSCETQEVVTPVDGVCAMLLACVHGACIGFSVSAILVRHLSLLLPAWVGKR